MYAGLCGEMATTPYRVFLGTLPTLGVEQRFLRQFQPVFPWYTSRKRVKEQASEFIEIDLASCDPELILRYSHVYYVRRQLHDELIDKQLTLIETGKSKGNADNVLHACLSDCNVKIATRVEFEQFLLSKAKKSCNVPNRRELAPNALLEPYDYLCMMRVHEEDSSGIEDAEMKARSFLPRALVETNVKKLTELLLGNNSVPLDKKDQKTLNRLIPGGYNKIGSVDCVRPLDVTAIYRFTGERVPKLQQNEFFKRCLWGHVYRKYATHPAYLSSISSYWSGYSGLDRDATLTTMPAELSKAVTMQQQLFPALKFRSQYLYSSPDVARQQWKKDCVIPLLRIFPTLGATCAEDLAASTIIDAEWTKMGISDDTNPVQEQVVRNVRQIVDEMSSLYENNMDALSRRIEDSVNINCPTLSEAELALMNDTNQVENDGDNNSIKEKP